MRVTGIFTGTTSSPSRSLRQSHDRYAIRAGRNLPDKEFRSVNLTLFPEKLDFIFHCLCSWWKQWHEFLRHQLSSNALPWSSIAGPFGISRNQLSSSISADAVQRRE